ncbi:MAG: hypothetical protein ACI4MH_06995 [Candidatus Coproplasma sp.]
MKKYDLFKRYLAADFNPDNSDLSDDVAIDVAIPMDDTGYNRINIRYLGNMLSLTVSYGNFKPRHGRALTAFVDGYNRSVDAVCTLKYSDNRILAEYNAACADDSQAIGIVEAVINYPKQDNALNGTLRNIEASAKFRREYVGKYVQTLKYRACGLEEQGDHDGAMRIHRQICGMLNDYSHMEFAAMYYGYGRHRLKGADFPVNRDYQLECLMLAAEKSAVSVVLAYNLAKSMGRTAECSKLIGLGQKLGTWNAFALPEHKDTPEYLQTIADCYRNGTGCDASGTNADYYDRLTAGERQTVFKDMLKNGFEPVFNLMNAEDYYVIDSLADLDGIPDGMREQFLYGDSGETFGLPRWFIPLVNGLNPADRNAVLSGVKPRLQRAMLTFRDKVAAREYEIIASGDNSVSYEDESGETDSVWLPDFKEVQPCQALDELQALIADFMTEIG